MKYTMHSAFRVNHNIDIDYMDAIQRLCNKDIAHVRRLRDFGLADSNDVADVVGESGKVMGNAAYNRMTYGNWDFA